MNLFVCFLEESEDIKSCFEIIWPLQGRSLFSKIWVAVSKYNVFRTYLHFYSLKLRVVKISQLFFPWLSLVTVRDYQENQSHQLQKIHEMFKSFHVQCVLFGQKSGLFVSKSRHKKWSESVRTVFPKNSSDNTVTQIKQRSKI